MKRSIVIGMLVAAIALVVASLLGSTAAPAGDAVTAEDICMVCGM